MYIYTFLNLHIKYRDTLNFAWFIFIPPCPESWKRKTCLKPFAFQRQEEAEVPVPAKSEAPTSRENAFYVAPWSIQRVTRQCCGDRDLFFGGMVKPSRDPFSRAKWVTPPTGESKGVTLIESPENHDVSSIFWSFVLVTRKWLKWLLKWLKKVLTEINQLMVNCWFGFLGSPKMKGIVTSGYP